MLTWRGKQDIQWISDGITEGWSIKRNSEFIVHQTVREAGRTLGQPFRHGLFHMRKPVDYLVDI